MSEPCFSPSQTVEWLQCPKLWALSKQWIKPEPWTPQRLIGQAVHAWLAEHYRRTSSSAEDSAKSTLIQGWPPDAPVELSADAAWATIKRAVAAALTIDLLGKDGTVKIGRAHV